MTIPTEKFVAAQQAAVNSSFNLAKSLFDSSERLVALNLNTARTVLEDGVANLRSLLAAKNPEELIALQTGFAQPATAKTIAYYRSCYDILVQTLEEVARPFEAQIAEASKLVTNELEKASQSAPAGSEVALQALKASLEVANSTYGKLTQATRQVAELAETNLAMATDAAAKVVSAGSPAARARKAS